MTYTATAAGGVSTAAGYFEPALGDPIDIGPFTIGPDDGINGVVQITLTDPSAFCTSTVIVAETLCGFGNDETSCEDCPTEPRGRIISQSEPGSFTAGPGTGFTHKYFLVNPTTVVVLDPVLLSL